MKKLRLVLVAMIGVILMGCGTTPPPLMQLPQNFYTNSESKVGVYMTQLPKVDTHLVGASCLLCYAFAATANSSVTKHFGTLSNADLADIDQQIVTNISAKGLQAKIIDTFIDIENLPKFNSKSNLFAVKDFTKLKDSLGVDKLIVIELTTLGAYRTYNAYVPTSAPLGTVLGLAYTIDLTTNSYESYSIIDFKVAVQGEWDEPTNFPGLTNAFFQAVELSKEKLNALF